MRVQTLVVTSLLSVSLLTGAVAMSDPVRKAMTAAETAYQAGDWETAADQWERAATLSRQKAAEQSQHMLPDPLDGWKLADADSGAYSVAGFGGSSAERQYRKDKASVSIQVLSDSSLIQGIAMLFNTPDMAARSGMHFANIKGRKAMIQQDEAYRISFIVGGGQRMITITASGAEQDNASHAKAYAEKIRFEAFDESLNES